MLTLKQKRSGFTIVELLIVIVVIAILVTIAVVAYSGIQERTHITRIHSDLRNISQILNMYYIDNGAYPATHVDVQASGIREAISIEHPTNNTILYCSDATGTTYAVFMTIAGMGTRQFKTAPGMTTTEVLPAVTGSGETICASLGSSYTYNRWEEYW